MKIITLFAALILYVGCQEKEPRLTEVARKNGALRYASAMLEWGIKNHIYIDDKAIDSIYYSQCKTCIK